VSHTISQAAALVLQLQRVNDMCSIQLVTHNNITKQICIYSTLFNINLNYHIIAQTTEKKQRK